MKLIIKYENKNRFFTFSQKNIPLKGQSMSQFDHIFIAPKNWEASLAFYKDNLGFEKVSSWGDQSEGRGAVLKSGGFTVVIAEEHENKGRIIK